jgi:hypothetical protein
MAIALLMRKHFFPGIAILLLWTGCAKNPADSSDLARNYTPLHVGDQTQVYNVTSQATILMTVSGTTYRSDGKKVYIWEWYNGQDEVPYFIDYVFMEDGYLVSTQLDPIPANHPLYLTNPFFDQKLAKSSPRDGDLWQHHAGDTDQSFWLASKSTFDQTLLDTEKAVFRFSLYLSNTDTTPYMHTYYAAGLGYLGSKTQTEKTYLCSYKKIGQAEFGNLLPAKNGAKQQNIQAMTGRFFQR